MCPPRLARWNRGLHCLSPASGAFQAREGRLVASRGAAGVALHPLSLPQELSCCPGPAPSLPRLVLGPVERPRPMAAPWCRGRSDTELGI